MNNFSIGFEVDDSNLNKSIGEVAETIKKIDTACDTATKGLNKMDKSISSADKRVTGCAKQAKQFEKQIVDLTVAYNNLSKEEKKGEFGKQMLSKINELKQKSSDLKDVVADVQQELKNMASDTKITDSMGAWTGVIGNCSSAIVALGGDTKDFQAVILKLAQIQSVTKAVEGLTKAFQAQNLVLLKNPLVIGGAAIVGVISAIASAIGETNNSIGDMCESLDKLDGYFKETNKDFYTFLDYMKAAGSSDLKVAQVELNKVNEAIEENYRNQEKVQKLIGKNQKVAKNNNYYSQAAKDSNEEISKLKSIQQIYNKELEDLLKKRKELEGKLFEGKLKEGSKTKANSNNSTNNSTYYAPDVILPNIEDPIEKLAEQFKQKPKELGVIPIEIKYELLPVDSDPFAALDYELEKKKLENLKDIQSTATGISSAFNQAASSLGQFAQQSEAAAAASKAFTIAGAIAQLVAQFATIPKGAEIWSWIAGTVAGTGTLIATIASLKNASNSFATGGILGGSTSIGDRTMFFGNKGEMILNNSEQARLFNALKFGNSLSTNNAEQNHKVEFKIKGKDLVGTFANYNNKMSKI